MIDAAQEDRNEIYFDAIRFEDWSDSDEVNEGKVTVWRSTVKVGDDLAWHVDVARPVVCFGGIESCSMRAQ